MGKLRDQDKERRKWVEQMKGRSTRNKGREISVLGGAGKVCSDRMEGTEIESWTKSSEFSKGGLKEEKKAWITTHQYALSDNAEVNGGSCAWKKRQAAVRAVLASG